MTRRLSQVALCLAIASTLGACRASLATEARQNLQTLQRENEPARLVRTGEAYAEFGDSTRATQYFMLAIERGGDEAKIFPRLLAVCIRDKQYRAAAYHAENHLRKHPADTRLRFVVANLHAAMGNSLGAREQLHEVLNQEPNNPNVHYALAVLYRDDRRDLVSADQHFREYLRLDPSGAHAEEARGSLLKRVP